MFSSLFITNFLQNAPVENFWESVNIRQDMDRTLWLTFWATL